MPKRRGEARLSARLPRARWSRAAPGSAGPRPAAPVRSAAESRAAAVSSGARARLRAGPNGSDRTQADSRLRNGGVAGAADDSPYAYNAGASPLAEIFRTLGDVIDAGVPASTIAVDNLAWRRWSEFCRLLDTPPWRLDRHAHSGADPAGFDRESRLLCAFLIWCYDLIQPRSASSPAPQPQSCYNMVAAVRRVHRRANVEMVSCRQLAAVLKGITQAHIAEHGAESLLPGRKEPIGPPLLRLLLSTPRGTALGTRTLDWDSPCFASLGAMFALAGGTGFRKAEVALPSGTRFDDRRLRRGSLLWEIDGALHVDPAPELLEALVPRRDKAVIKPPRSKSDPDGTKFGAHPIYQLFDPDDVANAAAWLRRLELLFPCRGARRLTTPLFFDDARSFSPISHSTVDSYLTHLLRWHVPAAEIGSYSFHSFRIGFACALLAAKCPYDMIQALARWRSAESVKIYARLNPADYTTWVAAALSQTTTSKTSARLPVIDAHGVIATFGAAGQFFQKADGARQ